MSDIIQLLPDNIANQIAAGEVIQRPASAVKELLENAVDAGATRIQLIVSEAGKSLIQVIDNGKGMSHTDARLSFERHATSKIRKIDDLFQIRTMGFRGEALASIAAVAQVEMKTKKAGEELGTYLEIENSMVVKQEACACADGTNICMKNLFFNVPARRNFLKSNSVELRHIVDEFIHVAMAFPQVFFSLTSNGQQVFHLEPGTLKSRILQVLGNTYNSKLVQVKEETDYLNIYGFVGKPDTARKTRGDQYFFVNNRYIKSAYLNHAVAGAFDDLITKDSFPSYVLFIDLDAAQIDINVHPTKQEIKFEDEKIVYAFVQSAVKHALAQFSISPSLDFSLNPEIQHLDSVQMPTDDVTRTDVERSGLFQTFTQKHQAHFIERSEHKADLKNWKDFYEPRESSSGSGFQSLLQKEEAKFFDFEKKPQQFGVDLSSNPALFQLKNTFIVVPAANGFLLVHQQLAHERVLYERFADAVQGKRIPSQQVLFPSTLSLSAADAVLLTELVNDLELIGYVIAPFGNNEFIIQGVPADSISGNETHAVELLLEQIKHFNAEVKFSRREKMIRCMARQQATKAGEPLSNSEMQQLVGDLFNCRTVNTTPGGTATFLEFKEDNLLRMFGK